MLVAVPDIHRAVGLHLRIGYGTAGTVLQEPVGNILVINGGDACILPFWGGPVYHHIYGLIIVHRPHKMEPSEREKMPPGFLQCLWYGWQIYSESDEIVIFVKNYVAQPVGDIRHYAFRFLLYLLVRERDEIMNRSRKTLIVYPEEITDLFRILLELVYASEMQLVSLHYEFRDPPRLVRNTVIGHHHVLEPVAFLLITEGGHEIVVIRIIVKTVERRRVLKTLDQHPLLAQGIVIKGAVNILHTLRQCPFLRSSYKKLCNLKVLYGVEPAETRPFCPVSLVVSGIYHSAYTPHNFTVLSHEPHPALAIRQRGNLCERTNLVGMQSRYVLGAILVKPVRKFDKLPQILLWNYFANLVHILQIYKIIW